MLTDMNYNYFIEKYNVPAPRYTSYPAMPYWDTDNFDKGAWEFSVKQSFNQSNHPDGISLYVHLPFCESLCTYCGCNTRITKNHQVEQPYIQAVLKEWKMYRRIMAGIPLIREIHLGGGTPTFFSAENLKLLVEGLLSGACVHKEAEFSFEAHPANTSADHLKTLHDLGFRRLSIGVQDFDPKVQKAINRRQSYADVKAVTDMAREIGYTSINYDLIYGLPMQSIVGLITTIQQVHELKPDRIAFYSYAHMPWVKPGQRGFTDFDLPDPQVKNQLHEIGRETLQSYGYKEIGMDHFALPGDGLFIAKCSGNLHRNFMGYTPGRTQLLIGLGVSAISDSYCAFAQNVKTVEEYVDMVNSGTLPVFKGHILTDEDLVIRQHILNIMCKGYTQWSGYDSDLYPSFSEALERLKLLASDGLIELDEQGLWVTATGERFLRNICMAFDVRIWENKPGTQSFSMAV